MLLSRTTTLLIGLLIWGGMMVLVNRREETVSQPDGLPSLSETVFTVGVETHRRMGIYFTPAGGAPMRLGTWERIIFFRETGLSARVSVALTVEPPQEYGALLTARCAFNVKYNLHREHGFVSSESRIEALGQQTLVRVFRREGDLVVEREQNGTINTSTQPYSMGDAMVGFDNRAQAPFVGDTWSVLILDIGRRRPAMVKVVVKNSVEIDPASVGLPAGKKIKAMHVRGVDREYRQVSALYDRNGRLLRQQGILHPLPNISLVREKFRVRPNPDADDQSPSPDARDDTPPAHAPDNTIPAKPTGKGPAALPAKPTIKGPSALPAKPTIKGLSALPAKPTIKGLSALPAKPTGKGPSVP